MNKAVETELATENVEICPLCGSDKTKLLFWTYDRLYRLPGKFGTLQCTQCDLIRLSPRPTIDSISRFYPEDYGAYKTSPISIHDAASKHLLSRSRDAIRNAILWKMGYQTERINSWQKTFSPLLNRFFFKQATYGFGDLFPNYVLGGAALEVGCGNGVYLSYLKHHGWRVSGVDFSSHAARVAKETFGIDVFLGQLEESPFPDESFDYIHLSHVVEHFFNPIETMQKVCSLLKPGGKVFIEVPNAEGISAKISKEYWYGWDAPRHLFMFTPATLSKTLETANLSVTKTRTIMWDAFDWASTYSQEEKTGEKLSVRPSIAPGDDSKVRTQRVTAKRNYNLKPDEGDFICCWATKSNV